MAGYSLDVIRRIYDDTSGAYVEVRPDADALGLVELGTSLSDERMAFTSAEARMVAAAIVACADELDVAKAAGLEVK